MANPLRILVTDAHELAGLGVIRSLGRAGYNVIAGYPQEIKRPASVWSRHCFEKICYPDPWHYQFKFRDWIMDCANRESFDVILPISEATIVGFAAVCKEMHSKAIQVFPKDSVLKFTLSKYYSTQKAIFLGINCPKTVFISDNVKGKEWNRNLSELEFPIIFKIDNFITPEGVYNKGRRFLAPDAAEAAKILSTLKHIPTRIMAQEIIPGRGIGAFLLRYDGITYLSFTHRRLHEVPYTGGYSSFRESTHDKDLVRQSESLFKSIEYEGVGMVEFRRGALDDKPYFMEINGRFWGSLALALHAGADFPKKLIECYTNGAPKQRQDKFRTGVKCRNVFPGELGHLISILKAKKNEGMDSPPSKFWAIAKFVGLFFDPSIKHDHFWWTDPLPGLLQAVETTNKYIKEFIKKAAFKFYCFRDQRMLQRLLKEHEDRCNQPFNSHLLHKKLLFLCFGNICRSPFAEYYWNIKIQNQALNESVAISAGFHNREGRRTPEWMAELAKEYDIDLTEHSSLKLTERNVKESHAIFIMDRKNYRDLVKQFPWSKNKIFFLGFFGGNRKLEIGDPYTMSKKEALLCFQQIVQALNGLSKWIIK